jgi:hypothetical protein
VLQRSTAPPNYASGVSTDARSSGVPQAFEDSPILSFDPLKQHLEQLHVDYGLLNGMTAVHDDERLQVLTPAQRPCDAGADSSARSCGCRTYGPGRLRTSTCSVGSAARSPRRQTGRRCVFQPANPCRILRFLYGSSYTGGGLQDWWNGEFNWAAVVPSRAALRAISTVSSVLEDDYGVGPFIALQPCLKRFSAARPCSELR